MQMSARLVVDEKTDNCGLCLCQTHRTEQKQKTRGLSALIKGTGHYSHERFKETGVWLLSTAMPDE